MPEKICKGCGYETNTATSNWTKEPDWKPSECYVRFVNNKPEKGCGFDELTDQSEIDFYLKIINTYSRKL